MQKRKVTLTGHYQPYERQGRGEKTRRGRLSAGGKLGDQLYGEHPEVAVAQGGP